jgi:V8-like Glu-specific endopeptidase
MLFAAPAFAGSSTGKQPDGSEASRAAGSVEFKATAAKASPVGTPDLSSARALDLDPDAAATAYTLIGRTSDGRDVKLVPPDAVLDAIKSGKTEKKSEIEGGGGDPADSDSRAVLGPDNRAAVTNSTIYPYDVIGYLSMQNKKGEYWACTAAMIGPKTAITAANCLYNHSEEGGWRDNVVFYPALNGEDNAPYGGFDVDTEYVVQAYITEFKKDYNDVWQYDLGLVTFKDDIGNSLGWLGYNSDDTGDFQGTVVGYQDDKPDFTMWKSTCNVIAENITAADITHDCDVTGLTDGAPLYYYDQASKGRIVVGVNIGALSNDANWALRLTPAMVEWINSINQ